MKFAKIFDSKRFGQIVMLEKQDSTGAPEVRFFFSPEGFGVCDFAIGFEGDVPESQIHDAFASITPQEAIEIVDGYMKHIINAAASSPSTH